jgi:hypothetical protein
MAPHPHPLSLRRITLGLVTLGLTTLALAPWARAEQGEVAVTITTAGWLTATEGDGGYGPVGGVDVHWSAHDDWQVGGLVRGGVLCTIVSPCEGVGQVSVEARFIFDALTWVPWLALGGGIFFGKAESLDGTDVHTTPLFHAGVGVDWRPAREWSIGGAVRYHLQVMALQETIGPMELGFTASFYFD